MKTWPAVEAERGRQEETKDVFAYIDNLHSHNSSFLLKCQLLASIVAPTILEPLYYINHMYQINLNRHNKSLPGFSLLPVNLPPMEAHLARTTCS